MSLEVMTMNEIDEVSGAIGWPTWGDVARVTVIPIAAFIKDLHFGYADMRGNWHDNPFPNVPGNVANPMFLQTIK